uniref:Uncharacterized protein n=1 Tax=Arundo donax TaxID=35708 RepID=A0A0A9BS59_ARUDO
MFFYICHPRMRRINTFQIIHLELSSKLKSMLIPLYLIFLQTYNSESQLSKMCAGICISVQNGMQNRTEVVIKMPI